MAPGRLDLFGGHIDYNLYPSCSFAIDRDVVLACSVVKGDSSADGRIVINHMDPSVKQCELSTDPNQKLVGKNATAN